jgi:hypothetical protein
MMTAVAVLSLTLGAGVCGFRMWRLSRHYASRAQGYKTLEKAYRNVAASWTWAGQFLEGGLRLPALAAIDAKHFQTPGARKEQRGVGNRWLSARLARLADDCAAQAQKYERAAWYPWVSVAPDISPGAASSTTRPHSAPPRPMDETSKKAPGSRRATGGGRSLLRGGRRLCVAALSRAISQRATMMQCRPTEYGGI